MELYTNYWEAQSPIGVTIMLYLREEIKKTNPYSLYRKYNSMASNIWDIGGKEIWALQGKGIVEGMFDCILYFNLCSHCIHGKQNQVSFAFSEF